MKSWRSKHNNDFGIEPLKRWLYFFMTKNLVQDQQNKNGILVQDYYLHLVQDDI